MLMALWWFSLSLALFSITLMLLLILRRVVLHRRQLQDEQRRQELKTHLFHWREGQEDELPGLSRRDRLLLVELGHHLLHTLKGDEATRIIRLLERSGVVQESLRQLQQGKPLQRASAAEALSHFIESHPPVRNALLECFQRDPVATVRLEATQALLDAGYPPPLSMVINALWQQPGVSLRALQELLRQLAPAVRPEILEFLASDLLERDHRLAALLVDALGHARDLECLSVLTRLATSAPHTDIRAAAFRALATLNHPSSIQAIEKGLQDDSWEVRCQAILCASRIGLKRFAPRMVELLQDTRWWVRFRAAQALASFGAEGQQILREAATDQDETVRHVASLVLAERGL